MTFGSVFVSNHEWFLQIMFSFFFVAGFDAYYQHMATRALNSDRSVRSAWLIRVFSIILPLLIASIMAFGGVAVTGNAGIYHTVGFFVLLVPLIDEGINNWEYGARCVSLTAFWLLYHWPNRTSGRALVSYAVLLLMFYLVRRFRQQIRVNIFLSYAVMLILTAAFWCTLAPQTMGMHLPWFIVLRAFVTISFLNIYTTWYWQHQMQERTEQAAMLKLARYDELTNAKTYAAYKDEMTALFTQAQTAKTPLTMVSLDVDHFRQVNEQYGHLAGNAVLIGVANTLTQVLDAAGQTYHLSRTGGEEFNIAFPGAAPIDVHTVISDCLTGVRNATYTYQDVAAHVTMSMGVTEVQPDDKNIDYTYKRADDNLYLSKRAGCDTVTVDGQTQQVHAQTADVVSYTFFAQSIVDITDADRHYRSELLLRMFDHGYLRWVVPQRFDISVDTQIELLQQVLQNTRVKRLAINMTLAQFTDVTVAMAITDFVRNTPDLTALTVEITDVPDIMITRQITAIYRVAGVRIDIDDVGSDNSYELVAHLLPYVDGVKFAMQNLRKTNTPAQLQKRIEFWADVAQRQQLDFVLEGVETSAEVDFARSLGIKYIQGYYFSKPALPQLN
ncbi:sensor domain-containing diguanylate cyclase [Lacticaseibacillus sharpeae]|uniref:Signal transduction diguanylate cyclase n=1 Tax=Lacticaseibacillus sharpeae JCM 1186 = DSM 20505 TaxID=1291052 RepID=A0A0R1ZZ79_9LACO|nr:diguanylate cyclase [Lacticaseibacillus sharpeae]KRM56268.1 Signal transduction diguanylate cyclase [Lacticaseibacillus sharpeae JCM 1186 = DSM 20505]